ncbi:histidine phosphatase family protein [Actinoplanes sp. TBRC 11911]|uniref:histidine phosphatase family protein n=1 Tax=Actinoplanes sp. TBRC 11911 TaxID=2729386 RepID=UPI00145FA5B2|nr:histidine phosphatase family protein [Actinoplanes sp. TBRC 11911]NMO53031.1 histidine phosphatase family protein [Actinoplanes sp. TBRC 11911]
MARIYVVQHAETVAAAGDPPLTPRGCRQATLTGVWLSGQGIGALYSSPLLRARQTAQCIAAQAGDLPIHVDERLRERMNWDGSVSSEQFRDDWARTVRDRDFVPRVGDSSRTAGQRMLAFCRECEREPGAIAVVTHGGITADFLRALPGDQTVPEDFPPGAVTILDALTVVEVASTGHLRADQLRPA